MKRTLVLLTGLVLASGCIKVEQSLVLKRDGSGSMVIKYSVSEQTVTQVKAMLKVQKELALASGVPAAEYKEDEFTRLIFDPEEADIRRKAAEYAAYGLTLNDLRFRSTGGRRNIEIKLEFADIARVAQADFFSTYGFSLTRTAAGDYVWLRRGDKPESEQPPDLSDPETVRQLTPLLGGFIFALSVRPPGQVVKTDAPIRTPVSASWRYEFDRDPNALWALRTSDMTIVFRGTGLTLPEVTRKQTPAEAEKSSVLPGGPPPGAKSGS